MYTNIHNIITQHNLQLSQLNDEELSQFSEYSFNIIRQFHNITIDNFLLEFHSIASQIIEEELQDIKDENDFIKSEFNIQKQYYDYLNELEKEYIKSLMDIRNLKKSFAHVRVKILAKKYQPEQRSQDWYDMRYNMVTASDVGAIIGISKYQKPKDIILKKCGLTKFTGNKFTWHGQMYEAIATSIYESRFKVTVHEFGLLQHETIPIIGASPDGITTDGIMIEIKCPYTRVINGDVMSKATLGYYAQIQVQLEVCDLEECHFWECSFDVSGYPDLDSYTEDKYIPENIKFLDIIPRKERPLNYITVPDDRRSSNGQEKGLLAKTKFPGDTEWSWIYPPFMANTQTQLEWLENENKKNKYSFFRLVFWKLDVSSNCIVMRDKKWFDTEVAPKVMKFWEEVELRRKIGCDDLQPRKFKRKSNTLDLSNMSMPKHIPKRKKPSKCMIDCSSDED